MKHILTITVPVPVPEIKRWSRWQVFLALFDRNAHFTTCDTLRHQLQQETVATAEQQKGRWK